MEERILGSDMWCTNPSPAYLEADSPTIKYTISFLKKLFLVLAESGILIKSTAILILNFGQVKIFVSLEKCNNI